MGRNATGPANEEPPVRMVVLAGQRPGIDLLARRFGRSHRSLIPMGGRPLIAHVLQTAAGHPRIASLAVCIEREAFEPVWDVLTRLPGRGTVALVEACGNLADSVRNAAQGWEGQLIVTTADHPLLSPEAIDATLAALDEADAVFTLVPRAAVEGTHRSARARFLAFRDGDYAACDIFGMAGPQAMGAAEVFRGTGRFDRSGRRMVRAGGVLGLALMRCRLLTLRGAVARGSRHLGLKLEAVVLGDGTQAIGVDDDRSYAVVRELLGEAGEEAVSGTQAEFHRAVA